MSRGHRGADVIVGLDLTGRRVVVCGGGPAAAAHASALHAEGAEVTVVAPYACEDLGDLGQRVRLELREPRAADLEGAWLVVAAQEGAAERAEVAAWAERERVWCVCDDAAGSARHAETTEVAGLRIGVLAQPRIGGGEDRDRARAAVVRDDLAVLAETGGLDLRRHDGAGRVTLVGGGPGADELLTVAGRLALAEADVVVADRLGPTSVLAHMRAGVELIDVGKTPGHHPVPQHEINRILVEQAQRGRHVVRLKGGDPFVLGRGGEEVLACREARVPVTVVPGISSALAVPALAGIPLTHRDVVAAFHVTSGHERLDATALACVRDRTATLVILMGVTNLGTIVEQALAAGADPALPAAIIERGSTPEQRVTRAPLSELAGTAARRRVRAPAVVVIGDVTHPDLLEPTG